MASCCCVWGVHDCKCCKVGSAADYLQLCCTCHLARPGPVEQVRLPAAASGVGLSEQRLLLRCLCHCPSTDRRGLPCSWVRSALLCRKGWHISPLLCAWPSTLLLAHRLSTGTVPGTVHVRKSVQTHSRRNDAQALADAVLPGTLKSCILVAALWTGAYMLLTAPHGVATCLQKQAGGCTHAAPAWQQPQSGAPVPDGTSKSALTLR